MTGLVHGAHDRHEHRRVRLLLVLSLAVGALLAALSFRDRVSANGVPVMVQLSYIDLSNSGPRDATGTAELVLAEGLVRLQAVGLPALTGKRYQGWLVNSQGGDAVSIGRFNADASGRVAYNGTLPPIADFGFDLVILTIEPEPDTAPQPSGERSIGGYFSLVGQRAADGSRGEAASGAPGRLPNTGDAGLAGDLVRMTALLGAMGLSVFVGVRLARRPA